MNNPQNICFLLYGSVRWLSGSVTTRSSIHIYVGKRWLETGKWKDRWNL